MRSADEIELWKKITKRNSSSAPSIEEVNLRNLAGFRDASFQFENGFICVCGGTGQGKTALLQVLERALGTGHDSPGRRIADRVKAAEVALTVRFAEDQYSLSDTSPAYPLGFRLVDLWDRTFGPLRYFRNQDIDVLKEGITPIEIKGELLNNISAASSKRYDKLIVSEIEGEYEEIIPYFEVIENGVAYDSMSMANGELSVLYLAWVLNRSDRGAVFLIEEPEAYLPPITHGHVIAMIASAAFKKGLCVAVTTHSASIVDSVPEKHILPLRREGPNVVVAKGPEAKARALQRLGLRPAHKVILVVEDQCAFLVIREILARANAKLWVDAEIAIEPDGESGIREFIRRVPTSIKSTIIIGVLDGDQGDQEAEGRLIYLPLDGAPEDEMIQVIRDNAKNLSKLALREREMVEDAIEGASSIDKHEFFDRVARDLGISVDTIVKFAFDILLKSRVKKKRVDDFVRRLSLMMRVA